MEYIQMTLDMWMETKRKLNAELLGVRRSFVRIGYLLRQIDDSKGYENDGYKSIADFAKGEYGMEGSTVSRFIAINREYSIDGYSQELKPEYEDFKRSQLEEMLKLSEPDRKMITADTSRSDIRELKNFNKETPEVGEADDINQLIEEFFHEHRAELEEVYSAPMSAKAVAEIVNPGGSRSYRKGLFFVMFHENSIKIKKFGGQPMDMTYAELAERMRQIYGAEPDPNIYRTYYGEESHEEDSTPVAADDREESQEAENTPVAQKEQIHHDEEVADEPSETVGDAPDRKAESESRDNIPETEETGNGGAGIETSGPERTDIEHEERPEEGCTESESTSAESEVIIAPAQNSAESLEVKACEEAYAVLKAGTLRILRQIKTLIREDHPADALRLMAGLRHNMTELKEQLHELHGWK